MLRLVTAGAVVAYAAAFTGPMGTLPTSHNRAAIQLRKPAGDLKMAGGPPPAVAKALEIQSNVMGVLYKLQGKEKPFTLQMRDAAMALHTYSQAPREGKVRDQTADTVVRPIPGLSMRLATAWRRLACLRALQRAQTSAYAHHASQGHTGAPTEGRS